MNSNYQEKLKDPRWQRCRLEIMQSANWKCEDCGDGSEELALHHLSYSQDRDPWEYPANNFRCLCRTCHTLRHTEPRKVRAAVDRMNRDLEEEKRCWQIIRQTDHNRAAARAAATLQVDSA